MQECWNEVPSRRHSALHLKMKLQDLIDHMPGSKIGVNFKTPMTDELMGIDNFRHQLAESGFRSKTQS